MTYQWTGTMRGRVSVGELEGCSGAIRRRRLRTVTGPVAILGRAAACRSGPQVVVSVSDQKEAFVAGNPVPLAAPDQSRFKTACVPLWAGATGYELR
jgi:hypothetical protein